MDDQALAERLELAREVTREAGRLALDFFKRRGQLAVDHKGLQDLVSDADREVETFIRKLIGERFPDDGFLGEEHGGELTSPMWVIDPIDGTSNFLRGMPYWSTVLAFTVDQETVLGLTHDPVHDELFWARRGHGAFRDGEAIRVSARAAKTSCVSLSYSFRADPTLYKGYIDGLLARDLDHRRLGSSALQLCHVADGRLEGLICPTCSSWDVIAGLLIVEEAGGRATRYTDGHSLLDKRAVAAANPIVAEAVRAVSGIPL